MYSAFLIEVVYTDFQNDCQIGGNFTLCEGKCMIRDTLQIDVSDTSQNDVADLSHQDVTVMSHICHMSGAVGRKCTFLNFECLPFCFDILFIGKQHSCK